MRVLGIETTCDETAAAVVRLRPDGSGEILSDEIMSQIAAHAAYGGVVPEIAARAHVEIIDTLIARALAKAGLSAKDLDGVAAAAGPGLIGGVMVGLMAGKGVALATGKPFVAVNHLEAHALTARLIASVGFPYLILLASGGHTQILAVKGVGDYIRLGATMDDAVGEAFDKTAKLLGLAFPGGPAVEAAARRGDPDRFHLPRPLVGRPNADFSLSGLKTAIRQAAEAAAPLRPRDVDDLCASFQAAIVDVVEDRMRIGTQTFPRASRNRAKGGGRRGRRRRQRGSAPGARAPVRRSRAADGRPAAETLHRQWRNDRLGGNRAIAPRTERRTERARAPALAARPEGRARPQ